MDPVGVSDLKFSLKDEFLAVGEESDKSISVWDVLQRKRKTSLKGHLQGETVIALAFSPDGNMLASGSEYELRAWNLGDEKPIFTRSVGAPVRCVAFSPDGKLLAYGFASSQIGGFELLNVQEDIEKTP